jgi:hypothetical protein
VTGPVQAGDELLELSDGEVGYFSAIEVGLGWGLIGQEADQVLHAP